METTIQIPPEIRILEYEKKERKLFEALRKMYGDAYWLRAVADVYDLLTQEDKEKITKDVGAVVEKRLLAYCEEKYELKKQL